ncbi:helix-turn-helix domain-containing protein [Arthrobacter sp. MDT3-44]
MQLGSFTCMPKHDTRPDLTVREVAGLTSQSIDTIQQLVRQGRFPGAYKGGAGAKNSPTRIPSSALDHYRATQPSAGGHS